VPALGTVVAAIVERRLGEEEVGIARELGQGLRRATVAGVGEDAVALDPEAERLDVVVVDRHRGHLQPSRRHERCPGLVLGDIERAVEHVLAPEHRQHGAELLPASRRQPQLRLRQRLPGTEQTAPDPGDEVAPVVEVEMRDRDRLDRRPRFQLAQFREDAGAAIEEEPALDEVPGTGPAGVRPGGGGADDPETHRRILPTPWRPRSEW
jgi:hypothetical protein